MAFDPYLTNPYFQAQYPAMYQMPDPRQQQGRAPEFTSIMTGTPQFGLGDSYGGAQGYGKSPAGSVVDTTGQFDMTGTASLIGMAMPGGSLSTAFGKVAQSVFGPHAVVGWEDVGIGHPQWGEKMAAIREADLRNAAHAARQAGGGVAGVASSRDITSGPSKGRGGISDPTLGRSAAERGGGGASRGGRRGGGFGDRTSERGGMGGV